VILTERERERERGENRRVWASWKREVRINSKNKKIKMNGYNYQTTLV
jgi:hypothetical protein